MAAAGVPASAGDGSSCGIGRGRAMRGGADGCCLASTLRRGTGIERCDWYGSTRAVRGADPYSYAGRGGGGVLASGARSRSPKRAQPPVIPSVRVNTVKLAAAVRLFRNVMSLRSVLPSSIWSARDMGSIRLCLATAGRQQGGLARQLSTAATGIVPRPRVRRRQLRDGLPRQCLTGNLTRKSSMARPG